MLLPIKGIGNWTIDLILLFTLRREDVLPVDDFHLKKVMTQVYEIAGDVNLKTEILNISEYWRPYRSAAVLYLLESE